MNTKATILLGALLSAGTLLAQSPGANQPPAAGPQQTTQPQPGYSQPQRDPAKQAAHLGKQLGLNSAQIAQITPILADRQQQVQNLRADTGLTRRARRARAMAIMQDSKTRLEAVMTDEQKQQYEQMLADRRNNRGRHPQA